MVTRSEIEHLAQAALTHLAGDPDLAGAFLAQSGLAPEDLRHAVRDPGFAEAILDFLCADDQRLLAFAADSGVPAGRIAMARAALEAGAVR